jgi:DNA-binding response OmpR family regulator
MSTRDGTGQAVVVVIEDDPSILELLELYLNRDSYVVHGTALGGAGATLVKEHSPSLVILDLMLPDGSGFDVLRTIRSFSQVPVIILTARDAEQDKILGLELGADDYMVKPFSPGELVARARAVLRRAGAQTEPSAQTLVLGGIELQPEERTVRVVGVLTDLTP